MIRSILFAFTFWFSLRLLSFGCVAAAQTAASPMGYSPALKNAEALSKANTALSGDLLLTWRTGGVTRETRGQIALRRPNYGRISLEGDYPQRLLVSDGKARYILSADKKLTELPVDTSGSSLDSPWWGLPFRFFFTGSVNPFGQGAEPAKAYTDLPPRGLLRGVKVEGGSPMGRYTETLFFNSAGDLVESSVQFGEGPEAALFEAKLTHVSHGAVRASTFRFKAAAGQVAGTESDGMLPVGSLAPAFALKTPDGKTVSLKEQLRGKKALLVNFWYYNCAPCRIEFPEFDRLYKEYEGRGLGLIAVNKGDKPAVVSSYLQAEGLTFPVVLGGDVAKGSVFERYRVTDAFPGTYLLDAQGRIVYRTTGADLEGIRRALGSLGFH